MDQKKAVIRSVSVKLNIDEEIIEKIYMAQFESVKKRLDSPDCNEIYLPNLGSFVFREDRATLKVLDFEKRVANAEEALLDQDNMETRQIQYQVKKLTEAEDYLNILRPKVAYMPSKYDFIRVKRVNKKLKKKSHVWERAVELRKQRYGSDYENMEEQANAVSSKERAPFGVLPLPIPNENEQETFEGTNENM